MKNLKQFRFRKADLGKFETKNSDLVVKKLAPGYRMIGLTRGQFSLIDLIYAILKKIGRSKVVCVTWSAGIKDVHNVKWMIDSDLIEKFTLITDHSYKTRQSTYAMSIEELFGVENIRTSEVHAKFCLLWNDEWKVTVITSMNLNANKTCEMFEIETSEEVFDFFKEYVDFVDEKQQPGFISDSSVVNKTLDMFFKMNTENRIHGWSEI